MVAVTEPLQIDFTVTPYQEDAESVSAVSPRSRSELAGAAVWVLAAASAVAGTFAPIERVVLGGGPSSDPDPGFGSLPREVLTLNGWGQEHVSPTPAEGLASGSGPNYGVLFCVCAGLMLVAAIWQLAPRLRSRWVRPAMPAVLGSLLLFGAVATMLTEVVSERRQARDAAVRYGIDTGIYLLVLAGVLGLLPWAYQHWRWVRDQPLPVRAEPPAHNPFGDDSPVQDLGPSPY